MLKILCLSFDVSFSLQSSSSFSFLFFFFSFFADPPQINLLPSLRTYIPGKKLVLNCTAEGGPKPTIAWYKDRNLINRGEALILRNDTWAPGMYTCKASNGISPDDIALVEVVPMSKW